MRPGCRASLITLGRSLLTAPSGTAMALCLIMLIRLMHCTASCLILILILILDGMLRLPACSIIDIHSIEHSIDSTRRRRLRVILHACAQRAALCAGRAGRSLHAAV
jgi:hypothetical protein